MSKKLLKKAKECIKNQEFHTATELCLEILEEEQNYTALVFLGLAYFNLNQSEDAGQSYEKAIQIEPENVLAYQGLKNLYENLKSSKLIEVLFELLRLYKLGNDMDKHQAVVQQLYTMATNGDLETEEMVKLFDASQGNVEMAMLAEMADRFTAIIEERERDYENRELQTRRMRLNAKSVAEIKADINAEILFKSPLERLYRFILSLHNDSLHAKQKLCELLYKKLLFLKTSSLKLGVKMTV